MVPGLYILASLITLVLVLLLMRPSRVIYIRMLSLPVLCIIFIACLILFSDTAVKAALKGLDIWASVVVPSLLPFFIASGIINATGFSAASGILLEPVMRPFFNVPGCSSFALVLGITSGYPVGAKITADLRKSGALTKTEAERLLAFTNNSGPLFIIGAVGTGMYGSPSIGMLLFICHVLACITVGFMFRFYRRSNAPCFGNNTGRFSAKRVWRSHRAEESGNTVRKNLLKDFKDRLMRENRSGLDIGTLLGSAVKDSVSTILAIGGFITVFSVVISILDKAGIIQAISKALLLPLPQECRQNGLGGVISGLLSGMLEITTGSGLLSREALAPNDIKLPAASFIIGWAGLSVHLQVMSIVSGTDINTRPYLLGKFLQGTAAALYTWLGTRLFRLGGIMTEPILGIAGFDFNGFFRILGRSLLLLSAALVIWICMICRPRSGINSRV